MNDTVLASAELLYYVIGILTALTIAYYARRTFLGSKGTATASTDASTAESRTGAATPMERTSDTAETGGLDTVAEAWRILREAKRKIQEGGYGSRNAEEGAMKARARIREEFQRLHPLPAKRYSVLIGRERFLESGDDSSLFEYTFRNQLALSLWGAGGFGKTALVRELAQQVLDEASVLGVAWTTTKEDELEDGKVTHRADQIDRPVTAPGGISPEDVQFGETIELLAEDLGHPEVSQIRGGTWLDDRIRALREIVVEEPYLLVVDNLETHGAQQLLLSRIGDLLGEGPSRLLLTSREHLGERPRLGHRRIAPLDPDASRQLAHSLAEDWEAGAVLAATDQQLHRLHQITGGSPLAIRLLIGQAATHPLEEVFERFSHVSIGMVLNSPSDPNAYYAFYRFVYESAWRQLDGVAQIVLGFLGDTAVERGLSFEQLADAAKLPDADIADALAKLQRLALVQPPDNGMYTLHSTAHAFAQDILHLFGLR